MSGWAQFQLPNVEGWLTTGEGETLALLAQNRVVLEIGSYLGRSTICMARTAKIVYALDWHRGDWSVRRNLKKDEQKEEDTLFQFLQNLELYGVREKVIPLVACTNQLTSVLGSSWADLIFVDGAHDTESVKADLRLALRCLKSGGVIALHDWHYVDVQQAAQEVFRGEVHGLQVDTLFTVQIKKQEGTA